MKKFYISTNKKGTWLACCCDTLVTESDVLVFEICPHFNLPKTQATENKPTNQNNNTAMKMVPKVNSRFPLAKLWPPQSNPFKHSSLPPQYVAVDSPTHSSTLP